MSTLPAGVTTRPAFRDGNVLRWLLGYGTGLLGDQIYYVTLAWTATKSASPAEVGLILAVGAAPRAVFLLIGGTMADRYGPKCVAFLSACARVVVMTCITLVVLQQQPVIVLIVGLTLAFGIVDGLFIPAAGSLPRHIVARSDLGRVQGVRSLLQRLTLFAGPPIGGFVIAENGLTTAFGSAAVLFLVSAFALWKTKLPETVSSKSEPASSTSKHKTSLDSRETAASAGLSERPGLLANIALGLVYVREHRVLLPMLVVIALAEIATAGPVAVGLPLLADAEGWGVEAVGIIMAGFGIGATTTALLVTVLGRVPRAGYVALAAVVVMGPSLAAVGWTSSVLGAALAGCITGLGGGICSTLVSTFVLTVTEKDQLGRVVGLMSLATFGGAPLSYALSGYIADVTTPSMSFIASGTTLLLVGIAALCIPALRSAEMPKSTGS